jgi:hypothetical protein
MVSKNLRADHRRVDNNVKFFTATLYRRSKNTTLRGLSSRVINVVLFAWRQRMGHNEVCKMIKYLDREICRRLSTRIAH